MAPAAGGGRAMSKRKSATPRQPPQRRRQSRRDSGSPGVTSFDVTATWPALRTRRSYNRMMKKVVRDVATELDEVRKAMPYKSFAAVARHQGFESIGRKA